MEHRDVGLGGDRGVALGARQQRHLAGEAARSDVGDVLAIAEDLERAVGDDDHLVGGARPARISTSAGLEIEVGGDGADRVELVAVEIGEQRDTLEVLVVLVLGHVTLLIVAVAVRQSTATGAPRRVG